jgi:hypothetical protein
MVLGFGQHSNVTGMQHIKGTECDANLLAVFFEFTNMIEYHTLL